MTPPMIHHSEPAEAVETLARKMANAKRGEGHVGDILRRAGMTKGRG